MGRRIAKGILEKKGMRVVGAVDTAKDLVGKDLGELLELGKTIGVTVTDDLEGLVSRIKADIAVIATGSHLRDVYPPNSPLCQIWNQCHINMRGTLIPLHVVCDFSFKIFCYYPHFFYLTLSVEFL